CEPGHHPYSLNLADIRDAYRAPNASLPDLEAEASLGLVRVDRERVPGHAVAPRAQATDAESHHVAADAGAAVDAAPAGAMHLPAAELVNRIALLDMVKQPGDRLTVGHRSKSDFAFTPPTWALQSLQD